MLFVVNVFLQAYLDLFIESFVGLFKLLPFWQAASVIAIFKHPDEMLTALVHKVYSNK